jgi:AcrR family transcriptional regulator
VVEAAAQLVDEEGLDALTVSQVARRLGVTQPALYRHIEGAGHLQAELALLGRRMLVERMTAAAVGRAGVVALRGVAQAWRSVAVEHPGWYEATDRCPPYGDPAQEAAVAAVVEVLARVAEGYGLSPGEARSTAWALRAAFHGFATLETDRGHPVDFDLDDGFERLVALLDDGLASAAARGTSGARHARPRRAARRAPDGDV